MCPTSKEATKITSSCTAAREYASKGEEGQKIFKQIQRRWKESYEMESYEINHIRWNHIRWKESYEIKGDRKNHKEEV